MSSRKNSRLPAFDNFIKSKRIFESLEEENIESVSMVDLVLALRTRGFNNDKILKVKNLLSTDEDSNVAIEDLVTVFVSLGIEQEEIGEIMAELTVEDDYEKEDIIYIEKDNLFYKYRLGLWKMVVNKLVRDEEIFDPAKYKEPIEKPKHIYKSVDGEYISSLPDVTIYNTKNWNLEDFKQHKDRGYK